MNIENELNGILLSYSINAKSINNQNESNNVFKITDDTGNLYLLKIYGKNNADDIIPGERIYHTHEQLQIESEILSLLADGVLGTATPMKNTICHHRFAVSCGMSAIRLRNPSQPDI